MTGMDMAEPARSSGRSAKDVRGGVQPWRGWTRPSDLIGRRPRPGRPARRGRRVAGKDAVESKVATCSNDLQQYRHRSAQHAGGSRVPTCTNNAQQRSISHFASRGLGVGDPLALPHVRGPFPI